MGTQPLWPGVWLLPSAAAGPGLVSLAPAPSQLPLFSRNRLLHVEKGRRKADRFWSEGWIFCVGKNEGIHVTRDEAVMGALSPSLQMNYTFLAPHTQSPSSKLTHFCVDSFEEIKCDPALEARQLLKGLWCWDCRAGGCWELPARVSWKETNLPRQELALFQPGVCVHNNSLKAQVCLCWFLQLCLPRSPHCWLSQCCGDSTVTLHKDSVQLDTCPVQSKCWCREPRIIWSRGLFYIQNKIEMNFSLNGVTLYCVLRWLQHSLSTGCTSTKARSSVSGDGKMWQN